MKRISLYLFCAALLFAKEVVILSDEIREEGGKIESPSALMLQDDSFLKAGKLEYEGKVFSLKDRVFISKKELQASAKCASFDQKDKGIKAKDLFLGSSASELWIRSKDASFLEEKVLLKEAEISSCYSQNPSWYIAFKEGEYDSKSKEVKLKNVSFHLFKLPVFYLPYFSMDLSEKRKSGLLVPDFSLNTLDGFYYRQSIYYAPSHDFDLELDPQIRTKRGLGLYSTLRYAGIKGAYLKATFGIFHEKKRRVRKDNLKNRNYYGAKVFYQHYNPLFNDLNEEIYLDATALNNIGFLVLEQDFKRKRDLLVKSEFHYLLNNNSHLFATSIEHFQDTSKKNNAQTLQTLPRVQYHKFTENIAKYLSYNIDFKYSNFYRRQLSRAQLFNLTLPLRYNVSLFNDYLNLEASIKSSFSKAFYQGYVKKDEYSLNGVSGIKLSNDLYANYSSFKHSIHTRASYYNRHERKGIKESYLKPLKSPAGFSLEASQFFYNKKGKELFKEKLLFNYDKNKSRAVEHAFTYYFWDEHYVENSFKYDMDRRKITQSDSTLHLKLDQAFFQSSFHYEGLNPKERNKFFNLKGEYIFKRANASIYSQFWLDLKSKKVNKYELGFKQQQKCLSYSLEYRENYSPKLSENKIIRQKERGIYFSITFYPLGSVKYDVIRGQNKDKQDDF